MTKKILLTIIALIFLPTIVFASYADGTGYSAVTKTKWSGDQQTDKVTYRYMLDTVPAASKSHIYELVIPFKAGIIRQLDTACTSTSYDVLIGQVSSSFYHLAYSINEKVSITGANRLESNADINSHFFNSMITSVKRLYMYIVNRDLTNATGPITVDLTLEEGAIK